MRITFLTIILTATFATLGIAADRNTTSLGDKTIPFTVPATNHFTLGRGGVSAVIVNNQAIDNADLPRHRSGYSGVASLSHARRKDNLFVPAYAGLNFEHIHDGTKQDRDVLFEPRRAPMELRRISDHVVELYQKPTPHWHLESCHRYAMLADGTIEMTFECIPRKAVFKHDYIGLFWASYIHQPKSLDIHFVGRKRSATNVGQIQADWIRGITPAHGTLATHLGITDQRQFKHDGDFPLTLVFNRSNHRFAEPWFYGVSHGMAFIQVFRSSDHVRITQSPSGGGKGNPAWDFQFFIDHYKVNQKYRMTMRAIYVPFESNKQIAKLARQHADALNLTAKQPR